MIFFDIDETLLDQRRAELAAASCFLQSFGQQLPEVHSAALFCEVWRRLREKHAQAFFGGLVSHEEQHRRRIRDLFGTVRLSDHEADARYALYLQSYRRGWALFDDVLPCLDALRHRRLGIISNGNTRQQLEKLAWAGVRQRFEVVVISEDVGVAKPQRDIFLRACQQAQCHPAECIYVGDRLDVDAHASRAAGMRGIWLARDGKHRPDDVETIHALTDLLVS